eukprot:857420_1
MRHCEARVNFGMLLRKKMITNPRRGLFHQRAPSDIGKRTVREIIPHRTKRGSSALKNMKDLEGIPPTYANLKRMVVSDALALMCIKPGRKTMGLGDLSLFGSKLISKLEDTMIASSTRSRLNTHPLAAPEFLERVSGVLDDVFRNGNPLEAPMSLETLAVAVSLVAEIRAGLNLCTEREYSSQQRAVVGGFSRAYESGALDSVTRALRSDGCATGRVYGAVAARVVEDRKYSRNRTGIDQRIHC